MLCSISESNSSIRVKNSPRTFSLGGLVKIRIVTKFSLTRTHVIWTRKLRENAAKGRQFTKKDNRQESNHCKTNLDTKKALVKCTRLFACNGRVVWWGPDFPCINLDLIMTFGDTREPGRGWVVHLLCLSLLCERSPLERSLCLQEKGLT